MKTICAMLFVGAMLWFANGCGNVFKKTYTSIGENYVLGYVYGNRAERLYYITDEREQIDVVPWGIEKMAITRTLIYGRCQKVQFPPENPDFFKGMGPDPFNGYFVVNKKSRKAFLGLSEAQFKGMLDGEGIAWPPTLYEPRKWFR